MKQRIATCCAAAWLLAAATSARAEDIVSVRVDGGASIGPNLMAWDAGYGISWDTFVDSQVIRVGAVVSMLSYPEQGVTPALLTLTPEVGYHPGRETDFRVYYTLQLPMRLMKLEARYERPWYEEWFLGARAGAEIEQRDRELGVRGRLGLFAGCLRRDDGVVAFAASLRLIVELGKPNVPKPPPLPCNRMCPDGMTPRSPTLPCPPAPPNPPVCKDPER